MSVPFFSFDIHVHFDNCPCTLYLVDFFVSPIAPSVPYHIRSQEVGTLPGAGPPPNGSFFHSRCSICRLSSIWSLHIQVIFTIIFIASKFIHLIFHFSSYFSHIFFPLHMNPARPDSLSFEASGDGELCYFIADTRRHWWSLMRLPFRAGETPLRRAPPRRLRCGAVLVHHLACSHLFAACAELAPGVLGACAMWGRGAATSQGVHLWRLGWGNSHPADRHVNQLGGGISVGATVFIPL